MVVVTRHDREKWHAMLEKSSIRCSSIQASTRGDEYAKNTSREIDQNVKLLIHDEYFGDMVTWH